MNRLLMIAGGLALAYFTVGGQVSTAVLDRLHYELAGIRKGDIRVRFPDGKLTVLLNLRLFLKQSFGVPLNLTGINLHFSQQGRPLGKILDNQSITLPHATITEVKLPLSVGVEGFAMHLQELLKGGRISPLATIQVSGTIHLSNGISLPISTSLNFLDYV